MHLFLLLRIKKKFNQQVSQAAFSKKKITQYMIQEGYSLLWAAARLEA